MDGLLEREHVGQPARHIRSNLPDGRAGHCAGDLRRRSRVAIGTPFGIPRRHRRATSRAITPTTVSEITSDAVFVSVMNTVNASSRDRLRRPTAHASACRPQHNASSKVLLNEGACEEFGTRRRQTWHLRRFGFDSRVVEPATAYTRHRCSPRVSSSLAYEQVQLREPLESSRACLPGDRDGLTVMRYRVEPVLELLSRHRRASARALPAEKKTLSRRVGRRRMGPLGQKPSVMSARGGPRAELKP